MFRVNDAIQWHLWESIESRKPLDIERCFKEGIGKLQPGLKSVDWARLPEMQHWIGYCEEAEIQLGTASARYGTLRPSRAPCESRSMQIESVSASIGTEGLGIFGAHVGASFRLGRPHYLAASDTAAYPQPDSDRLEQHMGHQVLLIDTADKRAWLVPKLSIVWHLTLELIHRHCQTIHEDLLAVPSWDAEETVKQVMKATWNMVAYKDDYERRDVLVRHRVLHVLDQLQWREDDDIGRRQQTTSFPRAPWVGHSFQAWDVYEILRNQGYPRRRKISLSHRNKMWSALRESDSRPLILCGENLGNPIQPANSTRGGLCVKCQTVPVQRECLVAMVKSLYDGKILKENYKWLKIKDRWPFTPCTEGYRYGHRGRIQTVARSAGQDNDFESTCREYIKGAVMFADPRDFAGDRCGIVTRGLSTPLPTESRTQSVRDVDGDEDMGEPAQPSSAAQPGITGDKNAGHETPISRDHSVEHNPLEQQTQFKFGVMEQ
ncbi:MAG: hypothetical protein Q9162_004764 [Coniocarpon cinnabarinum]